MDTTIPIPKPTTDPPDGRVISEFARLVSAALIGAAVLFGVGYFPTKRLAEQDGVVAMSAGLGICLIASILASLPIVFCRDSKPGSRQIALLGTIAVRMLATMALFAVAALGGWFSSKPLALWTGLGYLWLLGIETGMAIHLIRKRDGHSR